ncbi:MAG: dihydropteroate synthase [Actinomycetota bacterium]|nr:dihydropteroate synthase [Acidimicrobiia bacterium]MDQ3294900.1 dihydropteroate synthase [Actinomycetota bacterium]
MGVLNVTPDSFSDGGRWPDTEAAVAHGLAMAAEGADVIDVGGESTRPGAEPVDPAEEARRVLPVIAALATQVRVSIDTRHASVAEAALAAGATLLNDVSASLAEVAAAAGADVGFVAMHMQGEPATMQEAPRYDDVVGEVRDFLVARAEAALTSGVREVWIDPGIGFGKTDEHNLALLAHLDVLVATGFPVAIGTSRKGFLGRLLAGSDGISVVPVADRLAGSVATATWAMLQGAKMVRAHDVRATVDAAHVVAGEIEEDATCRR